MTQSRHTHWFSSGAFATIALVGLLKDIGDVDDQNKSTKWAVSGISIALSMAGLAIIANMLIRDKFVGTHLEGGMAVMMFGMWAAVLPAIMDPGNEIAVTSGLFGLGYGQISNPNLYFFSWGATLISLYIMVSFLREKFGREDTKDFHLGHWAMLVGTSFVVMANASRQFKDLNCDDRDTIQCDRTEFATGLGAASALFGFLMMGYGSFCAVPAMIDGLVTFLFLAAWVVGITLITFGGSKAAAPFLGNLYFFTWASFGLTARMFSSDVFKTLDGFMTTDDQVQGEEEKKMEEGEKEKEGDEEAAE